MKQELVILNHFFFSCCNAMLHVPRMWANVQTCFEQRKHTASGATCHLYKLDGDRSVSYVTPKQKDSNTCLSLTSSPKIDQAWCNHTIYPTNLANSVSLTLHASCHHLTFQPQKILVSDNLTCFLVEFSALW